MTQKKQEKDTSSKLIEDIEKMSDNNEIIECENNSLKKENIKSKYFINIINKIKLINFKNIITPQRIGFSLAGLFIFILAIIVSFIINKNKSIENNIVQKETKTIIVQKDETNIQKNQILMPIDLKTNSYKEKNIDINLLYKTNKLFIQKIENNIDLKTYFSTITNSDKYKELTNSIKTTTNDSSISKLFLNNINDLIKIGATPNDINKFCSLTNKQIESLVKLINPKKTLEYSKKQELFFNEYNNLNTNYINNYQSLYKELSIPKEDEFIMNLQNEILKIIELEN